MTDHNIIELAREIIIMRKYPLKNQGALRYPAAAQQFTQMVADCDDVDVLREIIHVDTGHVLPTATKQQVYEKLLADDKQRTPYILRAYGMHLVMFGYMNADGQLVHDTDEITNALYTEAEEKESA